MNGSFQRTNAYVTKKTCKTKASEITTNEIVKQKPTLGNEHVEGHEEQKNCK